MEGNLGLFGKGDENTTFVLPNYVDRMMTYKDTGAGQTISAGVPNVTGMFKNGYNYYTISVGESMGALYATTKTSAMLNSGSGSRSDSLNTLDFDASRSNSIYGASSTVQPPAISLIPVIRY